MTAEDSRSTAVRASSEWPARSIAKPMGRDATSRSGLHRLDGSFTDQVFAININDLDEFDVGADDAMSMSRPMQSMRTQRSERPSASRPRPATPTRRPTQSPTRCKTTMAGDSRSTRARASSPSPVRLIARPTGRVETSQSELLRPTVRSPIRSSQSTSMMWMNSTSVR